jgi:hypothetical protein
MITQILGIFFVKLNYSIGIMNHTLNEKGLIILGETMNIPAIVNR